MQSIHDLYADPFDDPANGVASYVPLAWRRAGEDLEIPFYATGDHDSERIVRFPDAATRDVQLSAADRGLLPAVDDNGRPAGVWQVALIPQAVRDDDGRVWPVFDAESYLGVAIALREDLSLSVGHDPDGTFTAWLHGDGTDRGEPVAVGGTQPTQAAAVSAAVARLEPLPTATIDRLRQVLAFARGA